MRKFALILAIVFCFHLFAHHRHCHACQPQQVVLLQQSAFATTYYSPAPVAIINAEPRFEKTVVFHGPFRTVTKTVRR